MKDLALLAALNSTRLSTYHFLARAYRIEIDAEFLDQVTRLDLSNALENSQMREGLQLLKGYLAQRSIGVLTDLAAEYASIFLGAGAIPGLNAFTYESVYTSPEKLVMQDARDQVRGIYFKAGLERAEGTVEPEDHIAFELEFMAFLCQKLKTALERSDVDAARGALAEQADFITHHLSVWTPAFCADIERAARMDFYKGIAKITNGYLLLDQIVVPQMLEELEAD
jgi:putative dimethyl sulfoxide reductase chaperone